MSIDETQTTTTPSTTTPETVVTPVTQTQEPGDTTTTVTAPSADWREALAADYKEHKSIKNYKSVDDLVKSHINLEKMMGQRQPTIIGEQGETVYEPDAYKYEAPEGSLVIVPEIYEPLSKKALEMKIPPAQFKELVGEFINNQQALITKSDEAKAIEVKEANQALKQKWGADFDENMDNAHKAFELFSTPKLKEEIASLPTTVKSAVTEMMANIFKKIGETSIKREGGTNLGLTSEQAQTKISEIRSDPNSPYNKNDPAAKIEMANLYLAAHGKN